MCNLYSITTNQAAIAGLFRRMNRYVGNLAPMPGVFPDYPAPVIRNVGEAEEMVLMRWGMPPPPRTGAPPVTNIRNTSSPHWRGWLKPENRCLVPANSFAECAPQPNPEGCIWKQNIMRGARMVETQRTTTRRTDHVRNRAMGLRRLWTISHDHLDHS